MFLVLSILVTAAIGVGATYYFNELIQVSNKTTYSLEEEVKLSDQVIEKAKQQNIEWSDLVSIFESDKKRRIAAHKLMASSQRLLNKVIVTIILIVIVQMYFVFLCVKKSNEK